VGRRGAEVLHAEACRSTGLACLTISASAAYLLSRLTNLDGLIRNGPLVLRILADHNRILQTLPDTIRRARGAEIRHGSKAGNTVGHVCNVPVQEAR
jgi:hypothetical protein